LYTAFFQLRESPFSIAPDPAFLYRSARHQEALGHLLYGTGQHGGFVQLTGEVGTGKTTVVRALLEQPLAQVRLVMIHNPRQSEQEFVQSLCDELGLAYGTHPLSLKSLIDALNAHLLREHAAGWRTVLIIDEAQQLKPEVLEQVRLLTNLETSKEKLLRIMLVGQPELIDLLARPDLRQLAQRITARHHLSPLSAAESDEYISHRLQIAGGRPDLFTQAARRAVHRHARGIPRLINIVCDRAMLGAYARGVRTITPALVHEAAVESMGPAPGRQPLPWPRRPLHWMAIGIASTALGCFGYVAAGGLRPTLAAVPAAATMPPEIAMTFDVVPAAVPASANPSPQPMSTLPLDELFDESQAALAPLARLWSVQPGPAQDCRQLSAQGLECLGGYGSLDELKRIDLPAVIGLAKGHALLRGIDVDEALIETMQGTRRLPLAALQAHWRGDYLLLWRPESDELRIGPANRGASVLWLRQRLTSALARPVGDATLASWDAELHAALLDYQRREGMKPDGVAGVRTLLALSDRSQGPRLSKPQGVVDVAAEGSR